MKTSRRPNDHLPLEQGDFVTIGENALTWEIITLRPYLHESAALIKSGLTGIHRIVALNELRLHTRGKTDEERERARSMANHPAGKGR